MNKYRTDIEIISQILETISNCVGSGNTATKTKIMYRAFLSYAQASEYLALLLENSLVDSDHDKIKQFKITERGVMFLKKYHEIDEMRETFH